MRSNTTAITVLCSPSAYFSFTRLQEISVSGISFIDCKMNLMDIVNATFVWSSFTEITRLRCCAVLTFRGSITLVQIEQCTFFKNTMMINNNRAITSYSGAINILNSNFSGFVMAHPPVGHGGALYASRTDVTIINSYFSDNVAAGIGYGGAAAYIYQGIVTVINSYFSNNIVGGTGGAIHVITGQLNIDSSNFYNNRANGTGGTVYVSGGDLNVTNTYFTNSTAISNGGALHVFSGEVTISKSHFTNNSASNLGGAAIYIREGEMAIINSSFANNNGNTGNLCGAVCTDNGRGLHIFGSNFSDNNVAASGGLSGGALYVDNNENVSIINCYFSNNTASLGNYNGGAICVNRGDSEVTISNSYFIDNNVATGSNYSGNAIYMHNGGMRVVNNSFCNMKLESDYIHVSSGNITVINNRFMIINDTASSGDHHDGIISYFILYVNIRLIDNNFDESTAAEYCGLTNTHTISTIATTNNGLSAFSNTTTASSAINKIVATSEPTLEFTLTWGTNSSMKGESIISTINVLFPTPVSATMKNVTSTIQETITNTIMFVSTTTCTIDKNSVTATTTQTPVHTTTAIVTKILPLTSTQSITSPTTTSTRPSTDDDGVDDPTVTVPFYAYIIMISVALCTLCCSTGCCCCCCCFMRKSKEDHDMEVFRVSSLSMGDQHTYHPQISSRL